jgi:hypothetical protein
MVIIIVATTVLAIHGTLDKLSVGVIFGTALGHAGTSASQKLSSRSNDNASH